MPPLRKKHKACKRLAVDPPTGKDKFINGALEDFLKMYAKPEMLSMGASLKIFQKYVAISLSL